MRVLFLTHRLPYAPNRGDRIRAFHLLRVLSGAAEVHLVSLTHDDEESSHWRDLGSLAATVSIARVPRLRNLVAGAASLPGSTPLTHSLLNSAELAPVVQRTVQAHPPDVVLAYCSGMAACAVRPPLTEYPFILDMVDVDSFKWETLAEHAALPARYVYGREARLLRRFEATAATKAYATVVVNARELEAMKTIAPAARLRVIENGIDLHGFRPPEPPSSAPRVVFCGVFNYEPNETAALWLAQHVWPLVLQRRPDARLTLAGMNPTARVRALAAPSIEVTGTVPDVKTYLWNSAVAVAPLQVARGLQNKVLEAVAAGLPCVMTPAVFEGLPTSVSESRACVVAGDVAGFADAVVALLGMPPDRRRALSETADLESLTWERQLAPMLPLLRAAAESRKAACG
jgi:sugar transferase (PEP-CTERM/EpsH1 system associated)